jgi:8-oxo-dGTP pyrophosphatase MutT (NUDIX family)
VTIWIDKPRWAAHGHLWSHLISDASLTELHEFAAAAGLPPRGFEGDHYDVPDDRYAAVVAAGAHPTGSKDLVRRLRASGLRMQKGKGETGVARVTGVTFADGTRADVDLIASSRPAAPGRVFAAMVFVRDTEGDFAVVHSIRRGQWGAPGGWRDGEESVPGSAVREVREETGLEVDEARLVPVGYERFHHRSAGGLWVDGQDLLQAFRTELDARRPPLAAELDDTSDRRWVTPGEFGNLCRAEFWWPLAARVFDLPVA